MLFVSVSNHSVAGTHLGQAISIPIDLLIILEQLLGIDECETSHFSKQKSYRSSIQVRSSFYSVIALELALTHVDKTAD